MEKFTVQKKIKEEMDRQGLKPVQLFNRIKKHSDMSYGSFYRYMSTSKSQWGGEPSSEVTLMFADILNVPVETIAGPAFKKEMNYLIASIERSNLIVPIKELQPGLKSCFIDSTNGEFKKGDAVVYNPEDKSLENEYIVITDGNDNFVFSGGNPDNLTHKYSVLGKLVYKITIQSI